MAFFQRFFIDKLVVDDREPVTIIHLPGVEGAFGVYAPNLAFWNQLLAVSNSANASIL